MGWVKCSAHHSRLRWTRSLHATHQPNTNGSAMVPAGHKPDSEPRILRYGQVSSRWGSAHAPITHKPDTTGRILR